MNDTKLLLKWYDSVTLRSDKTLRSILELFLISKGETMSTCANCHLVGLPSGMVLDVRNRKLNQLIKTSHFMHHP